METIEIKCETKETMNIAEMTEFQGGLKKRNDIDCDKIKLSILKYGFSFPFFVWKNGCMELSEKYCDVIRKRYTLYAKQNGLKITSGCLE